MKQTLRLLAASLALLVSLGMPALPARATPVTSVEAAAPRYMAGPMEQWKQFSTEEKVSRLRQAIEMARTQADRWEKAVKMVSERSRKVKGADERKLMRHHRDLVKLKHKAAVKQIEVLEFMLKMVQKNPDANIFPGQDPAS